jgi:cell division septation protein DedD
MNEHLRDRIVRKLDALGDDRGYQILDYVEFLESRYAERQTSGSAFSRFTEAVEDRLRAGKVSASTIAEAMGLMNRAANVLNGALAAGRSVANDIVTASRTSGSTPAATPAQSSSPAASAPPSPNPAPTNGAGSAEASSPAHDTKIPGSGEEKL